MGAGRIRVAFFDIRSVMLLSCALYVMSKQGVSDMLL